MIEFIQDGDIFKSNCEALVNPVNCEGVMGKGLALDFFVRFPMTSRQFNNQSLIRGVKPGNSYTIQTSFLETPNRYLLEMGDVVPKYIAHVTTKDKWRDPSRENWIVTGLKCMAADMANRHLKSVAVPALGCGNGGLKWKDIKPVMAAALAEAEALHQKGLHVMIYEPKEN